MLRPFLAAALAASISALPAAQNSRPGQPAQPSQPQRPPSQPSRDTPAQPSDATAPTGRLTGRVLAADTGRPIRRARVLATTGQAGARGALTDDDGVFELADLPAGRYTLTASKTGFVTLSYGQRRPFQGGTPLQLADAQQMKGLDFRLPRGSVIGGRISDEIGEPMPGVSVRVMRYQYAQGERQLIPAGNAQTDDRGAFRVWGLNPGEYHVMAVSQNFDFGARAALAQFFAGGGPGFGGRGGGGRGGRGGPPAPTADPSSGDDETAKAYAPTYYPGVGSTAESRPVTVGIGEELLDVNFSLMLVRTARVTGTVVSADGTITYSGQVSLSAENGGGGGRGQFGTNFGSRINWEGRFAIGNVPPGRYTLRARGNDTDPPMYAVQPLTVASGEAADISVVLSPGAIISGTVKFDGANPPDASQVRLTAPSAEAGDSLGGNPNARVEKDGTFTLNGVSAGMHWIRSAGQLRGWSLKSVTIDGVDTADTPLSLRSGQRLDNVTIMFTSQQTEINGTVTDNRSQPVTDFTVLAFTVDAALWRPLSRQIGVARPDQTGKFQIRGLPPGTYYVVPIDPAEQGEWFEPAFLDQHRAGAARVTLGEGDTKTQDFRITTR